MSDDDHILTHLAEPPQAPPPPIPFARPKRGLLRGHHLPRPHRPRMKKLRLLMILFGLGVLAAVSLLFGMMMAIASDLPQLENRYQYKQDIKNSYLYDDQNQPIGILAPPQNIVLDGFDQISPYMRRAIVAVEDHGFWHESGIDIRGLARAALNDVTGGPTEGASTIPEEFVKNALKQEGNRTIFEKVREAVLAYQLTREWKRTRILREYLNSIYFGHGAYGIESAARVYFGSALGYNEYATTATSPHACGDANAADPHLAECASKLTPVQAALLAGMVANPSEFDPIANPQDAKGRRDLVLFDMMQQRYISRSYYEEHKNDPVPSSVSAPQQPPAAPYFTSWVEPQVVAALQREGLSPSVAAYRAYYGGLKIKTTIDLKMQQAAQNAIDAEFPAGSGGPTASLVAIDNKTGQVRAMVSGNGNYQADPFNLATQGHRQPGSSMKVFTLATALTMGKYGPDSVIDSAPQDFIVPNSAGKEHFIVHNFGNTYSGPITLSEATAISDNTVFSQVGINTGTKNIARMAHRMGIRSPISTNYAMTLGGLKVGVSPLDMAHAYETVAEGGVKVYDPKLGDLDVPARAGPTGIQSISCPKFCPDKFISDHPIYQRIFPAAVAAEIHQMLQGVVSSGGTAPLAAIPGVDVVGKTGTTSNYIDAWFVGWTPQITTAVWVGYPNSAVQMNTNYNGAPVEGGTFPAIIWHNFMVQALQIAAIEQADRKHPGSTTTGTTTGQLLTATGATGTSTQPATTTTTPQHTATGTTTGTGGTGPAVGTPGTGTGPANGTATTGGGTAGGGTPTTAGGGTAGGGTPTTAGGGTATGSGGAGLGGG
jgi:penicillin-binding protein 1A